VTFHTCVQCILLSTVCESFLHRTKYTLQNISRNNYLLPCSTSPYHALRDKSPAFHCWVLGSVAKLVDVRFVVDKLASWQAFCRHFDCARCHLLMLHTLLALLHQCYITWHYGFTNAPHPGIITSPMIHSLALSLQQSFIHWHYHFTNAPYCGIITSTILHTLALSLHLCSISQYYHFTNALCQLLSPHQCFIP
jgi:hypothetical protein